MATYQIRVDPFKHNDPRKDTLSRRHFVRVTAIVYVTKYSKIQLHFEILTFNVF